MAQSAMSRIELHFKCNKLEKRDPIVMIYFKRVGEPEYVGQTEHLTNTQNPDWSVSVLVDYFFEEEQELICKVFHKDRTCANGSSPGSLLGQYSFALGKLMATRGQKLSGNMATLNGKVARGTMTVHGEVMDRSNKVAIMQFGCRDIPKSSRRCLFRKRKAVPMLVLRRVREDGEWVKVSETGAAERTRSPIWSEFESGVGRLCNGDVDRPLKVEIVDVTRDNDNPPILCEVETTLRALESADGQDISLKHASKAHESGGTLQSSVRLIEIPTFIDYLSGGLELNLHIGIDFTASNGNPMDPNSLHCLLNPNTHNQYQQVIQSVGSILQHYDSDQMYPVWGFGAKPSHNVSHCFPCNESGGEVFGLDGVHKAYLSAAQRVQFSGPTLFAPMINRLISDVQTTMSAQPYSYHIMLILTDGCIHDMDQTISAIVRSSRLPISLIIVGIGEADFSNMDALDADTSRLQDSNGNVQQHDNVQFVPYSSCEKSSCRLAREVLMELPQQVVTHFKMRGMPPPVPREGDAASFHRGNTVTSIDALNGISYAGQNYVTACAPSAPPTCV